jgi:hypothetical protein
MIGVAGSYGLYFNLADEKNFIEERDLQSFTIIEKAGNVLPVFELNFSTIRDDIFRKLHEGNVLQLSYGKGDGEVYNSTLRATSVRSPKSGEGKRNIRAVGIYSTVGYINNDSISISAPMSGMERIKAVASKYFKFESNVAKSQDSQRWIQYNQSDRNHVLDVWLHCDMGKSFPAVGITSDGKFIFKDIKTELKNEPKWNFVPVITKAGSKDIVYDADPLFEFDTGFINNWVGYGREKTIYDVEAGTTSTILETPETILSLSKSAPRAKEVTKRAGPVGFINDNVHDNYQSSNHFNLTSLASFGTTRVTLSFRNRFLPVKVLDLVRFKEGDINSQGKESAESMSGLYFISKVSRTVANKQFTTVVELCKESHNAVKNA